MVRRPSPQVTARSDLPACRARSSPASRRGRERARRRASRARARPTAVSASGRRSRARAPTIAARISSNMSNDGVDAGLSVAMQTRIPASLRAARGATPQPSIPFERGQCATATSCSARSAISSSSAVTQCAATTCESRRPLSASVRIPVVPGGWTSSARTTPSRRSRFGGTRSRHRSPPGGSRSEGPARCTRGRARSSTCRARAARCRVGRRRTAWARSASCIVWKRAWAAPGVVSEHLEEDRAAQPELCAGGGRSADEAAVAHGRDSGAEAVEGAEPGDRLHVLEVDP